MNRVEFHFDFGALAPALEEQAAAQGFQFAEAPDHLQKDADAIARLQIRGLIPDSTAHKARERLMRNAAKMLKPCGELDGSVSVEG